MEDVVSSIQLLSRSGVTVRSTQDTKFPVFQGAALRAAFGSMKSAGKLKALNRGKGSKHGS